MDLLSEKQVATVYPLSKSWLQKARMRGDGPNYLKVRSRVFYRAADIEAFLSAQPICRSTAEYETSYSKRVTKH